MSPQTLTPMTNAQSQCGTSVSRAPCIGAPALLQADMQLAESALAFRQGVDNRLLQRHVDLHRHDAFVRPGEAVRGLFDCIFLDVGHDHIGARLGKHRGDSEADAGSGTRVRSRFSREMFRKAPCLSWRPSADRSTEDAQIVSCGPVRF